ncbi:solute carrier family 23 member 1-like isoform X2 [Rhopilema esculentum]|uniref:solute carrier family 23 member 1-like isoform X2 n=1 Tax=Rhopilema esculentum TaxID=499914 RepID=UPI0031E0FA19|eukprot:gene14322-5362_t
MDSSARRSIMESDKEYCKSSRPPDSESSQALGLQYRIDESPSWPLCIFLGLQHYLTMFGATIAVPFLLAPSLCIADNPLILGEVISTIFFVSGIATLLQTFLGNRLPIVQGATFSFLGPTFVILSLPGFKCPVDSQKGNNTTGSTHDWRIGMREVQGAIMVSSLFQIILGFSGLVGLITKFIGPLTVTPTISLIGLSLFPAAGFYSGKQWGIACLTVFLILLFSQVLTNKKVPLPWISSERKLTVVWVPIFKLFPILLAIVLAWVVSAIVTAAGGFSSNPKAASYSARTDSRIGVLKNADWFRIPYPGQWGTPTLSLAGVFGMLAGVLASMIESIGDYYACARLSGAPPPPGHAINRGIGMEGIGCLLAGAFGSGNGTTSYGENIAAIGITKVGSRRVIQFGAIFMLILGALGKFGALFATIPEPIVGGMFWTLFGMILAVGLSNLQYVNMNSSRNLFVLGFSFFTGMVIPDWLEKNPGAINTGVEELDQIIEVLLKTEMAVACIIAMILDNTLPGTDEDRGIISWRKETVSEGSMQTSSIHVYDPICTKLWVGRKWLKYVPFLPYYGNYEDNAPTNIEMKPCPSPESADIAIL